MNVCVYSPGKEQSSGTVIILRRTAKVSAYRLNDAVPNSDIPVELIRAGNNQAAAQNQIVFGHLPASICYAEYMHS